MRLAAIFGSLYFDYRANAVVVTLPSFC